MRAAVRRKRLDLTEQRTEQTGLFAQQIGAAEKKSPALFFIFSLFHRCDLGDDRGPLFFLSFSRSRLYKSGGNLSRAEKSPPEPKANKFFYSRSKKERVTPICTHNMSCKGINLPFTRSFLSHARSEMHGKFPNIFKEKEGRVW